MSSRYRQMTNADQNVHFSRAMFGEAEHSRMTATPFHYTSGYAGDIIPIYCREILPDEDMDLSLDFVIRQTTLQAPTMGQMKVDFYAFWVPNRIVNDSWKAVEGENYSGSWTAPQVTLAPLKYTTDGTTQIPVHSVADYYGIPTQEPMPNSVLAECNDLKFRGYVMIYNEHFRDQNYQPPIPMSTLNVYQGFLDDDNSNVSLAGVGNTSIDSSTVSDGGFGAGAVSHALYGAGNRVPLPVNPISILPASSYRRFRATHRPFKANKLHDYFTSGLPSPQKAQQTVFAPVTGNLSDTPVVTKSANGFTGIQTALRFLTTAGETPSNMDIGTISGQATQNNNSPVGNMGSQLYPSNLYAKGQDITGLAIDVADIRMAAAIQQVYEVMARGGSRYRSIVASFFGIDVDDPFTDYPVCLGHIQRDLELYQTAQTSQSGDTPQGNLAGFGYTANSGHLFSHHFVEHGYVHVFAVIRHRNIYSSFMAKDWFRKSMLDYYLPQLANISEQPIMAREVNPFAPNPNEGFSFQEAWAEYRYEPDYVTGGMRPQPQGTESLALWNYADDFDKDLQISDGNWLKSNSEEVLNRTITASSTVSPQFKMAFHFKVDKTLPMPTYSVPGMDII